MRKQIVKETQKTWCHFQMCAESELQTAAGILEHYRYSSRGKVNVRWVEVTALFDEEQAKEVRMRSANLIVIVRKL